MSTLRFVVPGPPVPKARPRVGSKGTYTPRTTKAYESYVGFHALAARQAQTRAWPMNAAYSVTARIFEPPNGRGDVDNHAKSLIDGMQGVLFDNDRRVRRLIVSMEVDHDRPRVELDVETI